MGKSKSNIINWSEYNRALTYRGSITFWFDESAIGAWICTKHHGKHGRGFQFSDISLSSSYFVSFGLNNRSI